MPTYIIFDLEFMVVRNISILPTLSKSVRLKWPSKEQWSWLMFSFLCKAFETVQINTWNDAVYGDYTGSSRSSTVFSRSAKGFQEWIGEAPYYLCAWGMDDKYQFIQHCRYHQISLDWSQNYNDLQLAFTRLHQSDHRQRIGLKRLDLATPIHRRAASSHRWCL